MVAEPTPIYQVDEPWAKVPLSLFDAPGAALKVFAVLDYLAGKRGYWYGPQDEIEAKADLSNATVRRALALLKEGGYIGIERLGPQVVTVNRYHILSRSRSLTSERSPRSPVSVPDRSPVSDPDRSPVSDPALTSERSHIPQKPPQKPTTETTLEKKEVTPDFIEEMVTEFSPRLGEETVRWEIEDAMNHTASSKRKDKRLYVRGWLRRAAERRNNAPTVRNSQPGGARRHQAGTAPGAPSEFTRFNGD